MKAGLRTLSLCLLTLLCNAVFPSQLPTFATALCRCRNLPQTLADARERGWLVLGAASEPGAVSCASFVLDRPAVLVMGNEGYGLRTTVRRTCNAMLQVGTQGGWGWRMGAGGCPAVFLPF